MAKKQTDISVVIATHDSEAFLDLVIQRVNTALNKFDGESEIVVVDDGSTDRTWSIITDLAKSANRIRGVRLRNNYGQHSATLCGIRHAYGMTIVTLDDDLQHVPEHVGQLVEPIQSGEYDAAFAVFPVLQTQGIRRVGSRLIQGTYRWLGLLEQSKRVSSFRAISRNVADAISESSAPEPIINAEICRHARRIANISMPHGASVRGISGYGPVKISRLTKQIVFNYSSKPLRVAAGASLIFALAIGVTSTSLVIKALINQNSAPGWASLLAALSAISLPILFTLSVISEYLATLTARVRSDAPYLIREKTDHESI